MQIRNYQQEIPELRIHFRCGNDQNKEATLFATAGLRGSDWAKKREEGSHKYVGSPDTMIANAERALRSVAHD